MGEVLVLLLKVVYKRKSSNENLHQRVPRIESLLPREITPSDQTHASSIHECYTAWLTRPSAPTPTFPVTDNYYTCNIRNGVSSIRHCTACSPTQIPRCKGQTAAPPHSRVWSGSCCCKVILPSCGRPRGNGPSRCRTLQIFSLHCVLHALQTDRSRCA